MRASEGVSKALYDWAAGYEALSSPLRLNAPLERSGDATLATGAAVTVAEYIDGSTDRSVDFSLVLMAPWSEGLDGLNADALAEGEAWLDWVEAQWPENVPDLGEGREVIALATYDAAPLLVQVMPDGTTAKYQFKAHLDYRS